MKQKIYLMIFSFATMAIIDLLAGSFEHFIMRSLLLSSFMIFGTYLNKGGRYIQL